MKIKSDCESLMAQISLIVGDKYNEDLDIMACEAMELMARGKYLEARDVLSKMLDLIVSPQTINKPNEIIYSE